MGAPKLAAGRHVLSVDDGGWRGLVAGWQPTFASNVFPYCCAISRERSCIIA
jgi:hypothetical protein